MKQADQANDALTFIAGHSVWAGQSSITKMYSVLASSAISNTIPGLRSQNLGRTDH